MKKKSVIISMILLLTFGAATRGKEVGNQEGEKSTAHTQGALTAQKRSLFMQVRRLRILLLNSS